MNNPEITTSARPEAGDLKEQVTALRGQVVTLLFALIILSGTVNVFLYVQSRRARNDLNDIKPQATRALEAYQRQDQAIRDFAFRLGDYGRTHPDFVPILIKYGIPTTNAATPAPAAKK